ncbi:rhodanese-like domain-containing protein [Guyparkeria halophila]|uniref:Rhodanese-like domain-containing protein n=1 Tax=Guyparkeria halophila TaxID=47960 RepID=A0ABZ0YVK9_9GAMM|nr:rhodanese-like domain-containing protein [Guyparkeria halophila]WQH16071.1 rhodanese-like domain-containing protein [Guyparkeria halophila]
MNFKRFLAVPAGAAALAVAQGAWALDVPGPVVDPQWLNDNLEQVTVLQIAGSEKAFAMAPKYETVEGKKVVSVVSGHVPGAQFVDWGKVRVERMENGKKVGKLIPEKADFESFVQALGVDQDDTVVIVPLGLSGSDYTKATRLYWQMKYFGHDDMALLDGGLANWLAAGFDAGTGQSEKIEAGDWMATDERDEILATYAEVREAVDSDGKVQLLDARPPNQYLGVFSKSKTVPGHLPGAKNLPTDVLVRADGAAANFLPASSYRSIMEFKDIDPSGAAITYCNSGNLASGVWFVASEIMGNDDVSLYDGSMKEYGMYVDDGATSVNPAQLY